MRNGILALAVLGLVTQPSRAAYTTFLDNGPTGNRVDIVFMGDGYTLFQLDLYQIHIDSMMRHLFNEGEDPFPRYQNFFNAHRIDVISQESGADDPDKDLFVDTALDATYRYDGFTQRLLYVNETKADQVLAAGLGGDFAADMKLITINARQYGGGGGAYAVYAGGNLSAPEIALHELGHSFAGLADEYDNGSGTPPYTGPEPSAVNVTKDPSGSKWSRWIGYNQPDIGTIGAYQGGQYHANGIYRPSQNSKMRSLDQPFDAISREEFILDIYRHVDPLDSWLANDSPLSNPIKLWVDSIDPAVIEHEWFVNGILIPGASGMEFNPLDFGFGPGTYLITAHSFDPTDWVRYNLDLLQQDITWNVTYTIPEPASAGLIAAGILGLLLRGKTARRKGLE